MDSLDDSSQKPIDFSSIDDDLQLGEATEAILQGILGFTCKISV